MCGIIETNRKNTYTIDEFIEKARKVHGDKYDYSKVEYKGSSVKICIICHEHGEFWQIPSSHLTGCGCPYCSGNAKDTTKTFIEKAEVYSGFMIAVAMYMNGKNETLDLGLVLFLS